uniref:Uncharacterized protein n=1 Tax=Trichobilharzia regenti TaxID=157069 RepID=A0AA85JPI6_TRIRE|nr:unnamed protein product [Trichobilharzia regenti]
MMKCTVTMKATTTFRGTARSVQKECILIYNKNTHEVTVQLKQTREGRKPNTSCLRHSEASHFLPLYLTVQIKKGI